MNKKAAKSEVPSNLLFENGRMVDFHIGNEHLCCLVAHFLYENGRMVDFQTRREHLCCLVAHFFLKIDEWSIFKQEVSDRAATHANISGDPILSTQRMPRGRDRILSTQRIPHGRDPIFSTQRITRRRDPILAFSSV